MGHKYSKVGSVGMVGLYLLVYIRDNLADQVREVAIDRVKTGVWHLAGNKGSVCLRFNLCGMTFCFMNVHLHHGVENQAARNHDIDDTLRMAFQGHNSHAHHGFFHLPGHKHDASHEAKFHAPEHSVVVIFGDLNIRLDLPDHKALPNTDPTKWLEYDQMRKGLVDVLDGYSEGDIKFPPTYKYLVGTDDYDPKRLPAWCDRVVYKAQPNAHVYICEYSSVPELKHTSDHRPVVAVLEVETDDDEAFWALKQARSRNGWLSLSSRLGGKIGASPRKKDSRQSCCWAPIASAVLTATGLVMPIPESLRRRRRRKMPTTGFGPGNKAFKINLMDEEPSLRSTGSTPHNKFSGGTFSDSSLLGHAHLQSHEITRRSAARSDSKDGHRACHEVILRSASKDNLHVLGGNNLRRSCSKDNVKDKDSHHSGFMHKLLHPFDKAEAHHPERERHHSEAARAVHT